MSEGFANSESVPKLSSIDDAGRASLEDRISSLFDEWHDPLFRYLLMLAWDPADVEDIVQESFLRLHRHVRDGLPIDNVKAWLFRVGHNLCVDRSRRMPGADSLSQPGISKAADDANARSIPTPEERLVEREWRQRLALAIASLPAQQRQCLHLRREGFRYREIGQVLGIRESTVTDHLRRAIGRLSKELHDAR